MKTFLMTDREHIVVLWALQLVSALGAEGKLGPGTKKLQQDLLQILIELDEQCGPINPGAI